MVSTSTGWSWSKYKTGITFNQRRGLNGRYRFFHDENLEDAIILRYLGIKWSVHSQNASAEFCSAPGIWKLQSSRINEEEKLLHEYFLGRPLGKRVGTLGFPRPEYSSEDGDSVEPANEYPRNGPDRHAASSKGDESQNLESDEAHRFKYFTENVFL